MSFVSELKRRNVVKVGAAYLALGWIVVQITSTVVPVFDMPGWVNKFVIWLGLVGFPFVLLFSWVYELTPEGLKRESEIDRSQSITHLTSKRLDYIIIAMLAVAIGLFVLQYLRPPHTTGKPATTTEIASDSPQPSTVAGEDATAVPQSGTPDEKSIAVLPFTDMSAAKDQEYMSDGVAEELLNLLAKVPELKVIARTSSFAFKGKEANISEIAKVLNVAHVLEGSVRKSGNRVRITAQLIRTADSIHVWSETYDRTLDDIFAVQDEIAAAVVEQLKIKLLGAAPTAKVVNPEAYALFLQARQLNQQSSREALEQAVDLCKQALALDPGFAAAWRLLGIVYINQGTFTQRSNEETYALAREAIQKSLTLDPDLAIAHSSLGLIAESYDGDIAAAAQHYQRALALEPQNAASIWYAAQFAANLGRLDTAIALQKWSNAHDPLLPNGHFNLGFFYLAAGRVDDAIASMRVALRLAPQSIGTEEYLGVALLLKGEAAAALTEVQKEPDESYRLTGLAMVQYSLGKMDESDASLAELMHKYPKKAPVSIAQALTWRGERDRAFEVLEVALVNRDPLLVQVAIDPLLARLHDDPRWLPFLHKVGRAPEQLAAIAFDVKLPQ